MKKNQVHNVTYFCKRLREAFEKAGAHRTYKIKSLGRVQGQDIYFCAPRQIDPKKKNILIAGGFHGNEPAGSWSIVEFLNGATAKELNAANVFFLPLVNPTGFAADRRENDWQQDPNQGYNGQGQKPSREGKILLKNIKEILKAAQGGFLTLHEDNEFKKTYLWTYESQKRPGVFSKDLLKTLSKHFPVFSGGIEHRGGIVEIKKGIGFNHADNSFESMLVRHGITHSATTETPAHKSVPLMARVRANRDVIAAFIRLRK